MSDGLKGNSRLLIEVELEPIQGERFQPTGFPDLGPAEIQLYDNETSLLVESAQSMANRLEEICLNIEKTDFVDELKGLTLVKVNNESGKQITNSVREAHRIGSFYILDGENKEIENKLNVLQDDKQWNTDLIKTSPLMFELDIGSLLHGVWIAKKLAGGKIKIARALSSFIEAKNVKNTTSGGVKFDHVEPGKNEDSGAAEGQGNIPFSRIEYTAESITLFFNLDLSQIRNYGLQEEQTELLITLALWKIRRFLKTGLRLRTACDLKIKSQPKVTFPDGYTLPEMSELDAKIKDLISKCKKYLKDPIIITYKTKNKNKKE